MAQCSSEGRRCIRITSKFPRDGPLVVKQKMTDKTELGQVLEAIRGMETKIERVGKKMVQLEKTLLQKVDEKLSSLKMNMKLQIDYTTVQLSLN